MQSHCTNVQLKQNRKYFCLYATVSIPEMIVTRRHSLNDLSVMCIYNTIIKPKCVVNITRASGTTIPTFAEVFICQFYCNLKCCN